MHLNSVLMTGTVSPSVVRCSEPPEIRFTLFVGENLRVKVTYPEPEPLHVATGWYKNLSLRPVRVVGALKADDGAGLYVLAQHVEITRELTEAQRVAMAGVTEPQ